MWRDFLAVGACVAPEALHFTFCLGTFASPSPCFALARSVLVAARRSVYWSAASVSSRALRIFFSFAISLLRSALFEQSSS